MSKTDKAETVANKGESTWKTHRVMIIMGLLTLVWGLAAYELTIARAEKGQSYFDVLASLPANALGDYLAGTFAPLAFLWLAGAVFIQSNELKAQRDELRMTRNVLDAQVAEARASTAFIGEQTDIFRDEQRSRKQHQADDELEVRLEAFQMHCRRIGVIELHLGKTSDDSSRKFTDISFCSPNDSLDEIVISADAFEACLRKYDKVMEERALYHKHFVLPKTPESLWHAREEAIKMNDLMLRCSNSGQTKFQTFKIDRMARLLIFIAKNTEYQLPHWATQVSRSD